MVLLLFTFVPSLRSFAASLATLKNEHANTQPTVVPSLDGVIVHRRVIHRDRRVGSVRRLLVRAHGLAWSIGTDSLHRVVFEYTFGRNWGAG